MFESSKFVSSEYEIPCAGILSHNYLLGQFLHHDMCAFFVILMSSFPIQICYQTFLVLSGQDSSVVEQWTIMQQVLGSIPAPDSTWLGVDSALHPSMGR